MRSRGAMTSRTAISPARTDARRNVRDGANAKVVARTYATPHAQNRQGGFSGGGAPGSRGTALERKEMVERRDGAPGAILSAENGTVRFALSFAVPVEGVVSRDDRLHDGMPDDGLL